MTKMTCTAFAALLGRNHSTKKKCTATKKNRHFHYSLSESKDYNELMELLLPSLSILHPTIATQYSRSRCPKETILSLLFKSTSVTEVTLCDNVKRILEIIVQNHEATKLKADIDEGQEENPDIISVEEHVAATTMQMIWKGYLCRKMIQKIKVGRLYSNHSALTIQLWWKALSTKAATTEANNARSTRRKPEEILMDNIEKIMSNTKNRKYMKGLFSDLKLQSQQRKVQALVAEILISSGFKGDQSLEKNQLVYDSAMHLLNSCKLYISKVMKIVPHEIDEDVTVMDNMSRSNVLNIERTEHLHQLNISMLRNNSNVVFNKQSKLLSKINKNLKMDSKYKLFKPVNAIVKVLTFTGKIETRVGPKGSSKGGDMREVKFIDHVTHCAFVSVKNAMELFYKKAMQIHPTAEQDKRFIIHCCDGAQSNALSKLAEKGGGSIITGSISIVSKGLIEAGICCTSRKWIVPICQIRAKENLYNLSKGLGPTLTDLYKYAEFHNLQIIELHDGKMKYLLTEHSLYNRLNFPFFCFCRRGDSANPDHVYKGITKVQWDYYVDLSENHWKNKMESNKRMEEEAFPASTSLVLAPTMTEEAVTSLVAPVAVEASTTIVVAPAARKTKKKAKAKKKASATSPYTEANHRDWADLSNKGITHFGIMPKQFDINNMVEDLFHGRCSITKRMINYLNELTCTNYDHLEECYDHLVSLDHWSKFMAESFGLGAKTTRVQGIHVKSFVKDADWFVEFLNKNLPQHRVCDFCICLQKWKLIFGALAAKTITQRELDILKENMKVFFKHGYRSFMAENETMYMHSFRWNVPKVIQRLFDEYGVGPGCLLMEGFENINNEMKGECSYHTNRKHNIVLQVLKKMLINFIHT